jgi:putative transposase
MLREVRERGFPASKERVERLMRENSIRARHKRRYKATSDSKHALPIAPNLLDRNFTPGAPNQAWAADLTYVWSDEGWLYLAVVLDLFNREVVGWSIKPRMTADIVTDADYGVVPPQTGTGPDASLGSRQPVRQPRVPGQAHRVRHGVLDESERELLGRSVYDVLERLPNLTRAGIGEAAFALTCRFGQGVPRASSGPAPVT